MWAKNFWVSFFSYTFTFLFCTHTKRAEGSLRFNITSFPKKVNELLPTNAFLSFLCKTPKTRQISVVQNWRNCTTRICLHVNMKKWISKFKDREMCVWGGLSMCIYWGKSERTFHLNTNSMFLFQHNPFALANSKVSNVYNWNYLS